MASDPSATSTLKQTDRRAPISTLPKPPKDPFSPDVPPEILQAIFRFLPIYDLLRCRRVSKTWRSTLPGNDPSLRATLFKPSRSAIRAAPNATPRLTFTVHIEVFLIQSERKLPQLGFTLIFASGVKRTNMPAGRALHPLIWDFATSTDMLLNIEFEEWERRSRTPSIAFRDFEHLQEIVGTRRNYPRMGGWKDMLACVPPLEQVVVQMDWFTEKGQGEEERKKRSRRTRKMERGVTVGEVVRTVKKMLAEYAVEDVKRVCADLQIMGCGMCQDLYSDEEDDEVSSDEGEDTDEENVDEA
jgi:hypothetical protein